MLGLLIIACAIPVLLFSGKASSEPAVGLHPDAVQRLKEALAIDVVALVTVNDGLRNQLINQAIAKKNQAKAIMAN